MGFFFSRIFRSIILIIVLFNGIQFYLKWKSYNVSVKDFKTIASKASNINALSAVSKITSDLRNIYKNYIPYELNWVPLSGGGLQMRVQFLYSDFTEYIAIFASTSNTVGRSGFHWSNNTCTVLTGQVLRYSDSVNSILKESYINGQNFRHGQFESYVYEIEGGTHLVCYGRGFIPGSSLWVVSGSIANGDPLAVVKLLFVYTKGTFDNIVYSATHLFDHYKKKVFKSEL